MVSSDGITLGRQTHLPVTREGIETAPPTLLPLLQLLPPYSSSIGIYGVQNLGSSSSPRLSPAFQVQRARVQVQVCLQEKWT